MVDGFGRGLYEVRSSNDRVEYRVLFCISSGIMYLLHGFVKKTTATPRQDEQLARERQATVKTDEKAEKAKTKAKK